MAQSTLVFGASACASFAMVKDPTQSVFSELGWSHFIQNLAAETGMAPCLIVQPSVEGIMVVPMGGCRNLSVGDSSILKTNWRFTICCRDEERVLIFS